MPRSRDSKAGKRHAPTKSELRAACGGRLRDVIAPRLAVLFVGINPGRYSAAVGHHFARPGNRFWPALHRAGITDRPLKPDAERELLAFGYGITNIVCRVTATAAELSRAELIAGARRLAAKVRRYRPRMVVVLGIGAYRAAFQRPHARLGAQRDSVGGASLWVLPNPSGLNANYPLAELARRFQEVHAAGAQGRNFPAPTGNRTEPIETLGPSRPIRLHGGAVAESGAGNRNRLGRLAQRPPSATRSRRRYSR